MSDFITRLAARAVGAVPSARPRLPSLFEGGAGARAGMEVLEEEVGRGAVRMTQGPAIGTPSALPAPGHTYEAAAPQPGLDTASPGGSQARPRKAPAGAAADTDHDASGEAPSRRSDDDPGTGLTRTAAVARRTPDVDDGPGSQLDASRESPVEALARPPRPATARAELVHRAVTLPVPERQPAGTPSVEPPVRVHIGRLEVRAVLPDPPPPLLRERPVANGLSLADYLRGRRDAR